MTTFIAVVLEFASTGRAFGIVGLPTEVADNIVSFLVDPTNLVYSSREGVVTYVLESRFPAFGRRAYTFSQVNVVFQGEEDH